MVGILAGSFDSSEFIKVKKKTKQPQKTPQPQKQKPHNHLRSYSENLQKVALWMTRTSKEPKQCLDKYKTSCDTPPNKLSVCKGSGPTLQGAQAQKVAWIFKQRELVKDVPVHRRGGGLDDL